jgi:hypothetical protein
MTTILVSMDLVAGPNQPTTLRVMRTGLGAGTVTSAAPGIACGADCDQTYGSGDSVTLTASPAAGSLFAGWNGDCAGIVMPTCTLSMTAARSVRASFDLTPAIPLLTDFTPEGIAAYLTTTVQVNTPARFIAALPRDFKQNWILMTRSESLQTGTAELPRILLPNETAQFVFTVGMAEHSSYPGSHPDAIEYMQWDPDQKNFRFHEIILADIPEMGTLVRLLDGTTRMSVPARSRGVSIDDSKCSKCHSTRNVLNRSSFPGTTGVTPGTVQYKNKPNWDAYDSWGGMMPFNRDRIYQGSLEAAAFRRLFNPWTWRTNDDVRMIIEQLELQPPGVPSNHTISRTVGGANDGHVNFAFDTTLPTLIEPNPTGTPTPILVNYAFTGVAASETGTSVFRGGEFVTLFHSADPDNPEGEGRGVQLFDLLGGLDGNLDLDADGSPDGTFNAQRIADELIHHSHAPGNVPIDVRPIALAILKGTLEFPPTRCLQINTGENKVESTVATTLTIDLTFFDESHGMGINGLVSDTSLRAHSLPQRKADIQKLNLDRSMDPYLMAAAPANGLIQQYGAGTMPGTSTSLARIRQEVFRRWIDLGIADETVMGGIYVDREHYVNGEFFNTELVALLRYFLEPLGVPVDKWSMGVRGRSRTYTFADVFRAYVRVLEPQLVASLDDRPVGDLEAPYDCAALIEAVNDTLSALPDEEDIPTYTDIQRIFNKGCIECHGGLGYPPYAIFGNSLDFSEDEMPPAGNLRLDRSNFWAMAHTSSDPATSTIYRRITAANEQCATSYATMLPGEQMMPCGGPRLSQVDIKTIERWILGDRPYTFGDPHLRTMDGVNYDFQSAGEFVLLRGENLEIQARQSPIATEIPIGPDAHTGLTTCASLNSAVALRVGRHRISYQPNINGKPDPSGMQLRIDGKLTILDGEFVLPLGGRIVQTSAPGGIQVEYPGGTIVAITPHYWEYYEVWYLDIDARHMRATDGLIGTIAPGDWLPSLPDGSSLGPRPVDYLQRYDTLYEKFADAWRVSNETSLFDYAPGTSTATFTVDSWPEATPQTCPAPPGTGNGKPALKPLPLEVAQQYCSAVTDEELRAHCVQDVHVTGEPGFAQSYLQTEQVRGNAVPAAPPLALPENNLTLVPQVGLPLVVTFNWELTTDADGDPLTYKHCIWKANESFTFTKCTALPGQTTAFEVELESGTSYFWKIIAEDDKGGNTESVTRRIATAAVEGEVQIKLFVPFAARN